MSSTDLAVDYTRKMVMREASGPGDLEPALRRIEAKTGVGYWTLWGLWNRRRKGVDRDLFQTIRNAYLAICQRQLDTLSLDLEAEAAKDGGDALSDLVAEAEALVAKLKAARAKG